MIRRMIVMSILLVCGGLASSPATAQPPQPSDPAMAILSPADHEVQESFLTAIVRWQYPQRGNGYSYAITGWRVNLKVSLNPDMSEPFVNEDLPENQTSYRLAVCPVTQYYWQITPVELAPDSRKEYPELSARADFTTGAVRNDSDAPDTERYRNPRAGAHWHQETPVPDAMPEPLSPWYAVKSYNQSPPPSLKDIEGSLPVPVLEGNEDAIRAYWYCWDTLLKVWTYAPSSQDHQAVTNMIGIQSWGPWGSSMVFDTCFILHFARYGAAAYPFIGSLDDCYARQHENGFICREADKNNHEVYVIFPANPPLFAWAEWEWYEVAHDKARLAQVLLPIIKHYEWWMRYQRRDNGLYWTNGAQEADDSPRNGLMYYAVSASSYQALTARCIAQIAHEIGRDDLRDFFEAQHAEIRDMVNNNFWDAEHRIYNDKTKDGKFITELEPGSFCKHVHMFWPLIAGIAPEDRVDGIVDEIMNPASFNRRNGVASLSADSAGYNAETGQYWRGAVWPPTECMVQEGLKLTGHEAEAQTLAEKYYNACLETFLKQGTLTENLAPDQPLACGMGNFVGWGGIGPVANLIEFVLGFDLDASRNTITWTVRRTDRHGIQNLDFGGMKVDMLCQARDSASAPCQITVTSEGPYTLRLRNGDGPAMEKNIVKGDNQIQLEGL